jgi:hypothetical protein
MPGKLRHASAGQQNAINDSGREDEKTTLDHPALLALIIGSLHTFRIGSPGGTISFLLQHRGEQAKIPC